MNNWYLQYKFGSNLIDTRSEIVSWMCNKINPFIEYIYYKNKLSTLKDKNLIEKIRKNIELLKSNGYSIRYDQEKVFIVPEELTSNLLSNFNNEQNIDIDLYKKLQFIITPRTYCADFFSDFVGNYNEKVQMSIRINIFAYLKKYRKLDNIKKSIKRDISHEYIHYLQELYLIMNKIKFAYPPKRVRNPEFTYNEYEEMGPINARRHHSLLDEEFYPDLNVIMDQMKRHIFTHYFDNIDEFNLNNYISKIKMLDIVKQKNYNKYKIMLKIIYKAYEKIKNRIKNIKKSIEN